LFLVLCQTTLVTITIIDKNALVYKALKEGIN
jgi:hypothetical protein